MARKKPDVWGCGHPMPIALGALRGPREGRQEKIGA
jgi:hypothetical protein